MQINPYTKTNRLSFKRLLTPLEKIENRVQIDDAKKLINLQNLVLVTHSQSFPSSDDEDIGIGILSVNKGSKAYINFAFDNGFDALSIEPTGLIKGEFYSPYESSLLSKKIIVDLKALTGDAWANILDAETFNSLVRNKDYNVEVPIVENNETVGRKSVVFDKNRALYDYSTAVSKKALEIAFKNFKQKVLLGDKTALNLNSEFEAFKKENDFYLKTDSLYSILSDLYGSDYYPDWESKLHQTLFNTNDLTYSIEEKEAEITRLEKAYKDEIELFKFSQFVVNKQQKEFVNYAQNLAQIRYFDDLKTIEEAFKKGEIDSDRFNYLKRKLDEFKQEHRGVKIIGDKEVAYSPMDMWAQPNLFTKDEFLGAPPNLNRGSIGQDWGFSFIPKEMLFNPDGSLNIGGKYLKKVTKKAFLDNPGGLRIDHILGMIDPWVYRVCESDKISLPKFNILLATCLKGLKEFGINEDTILGLKDPYYAILHPESKEGKILAQRGVKDFDKIQELVIKNAKTILEVKKSSVGEGSRYIFRHLLDNELKELRNFGINEETIVGVIDPIGGIINPKSRDRKLLEQMGIKEFDKPKEIVLSKKNEIIEAYSKIVKDIILQAGMEVIVESSNHKLTQDEINKRLKQILICEDLGSMTQPLRWVMETLNLSGMRNAIYADPNNPDNVYREINPNEQRNYWVIGTHDSLPYEHIVLNLTPEAKAAQAGYISSELSVSKDKMLDNNPFSFIKAKVARLFCADNDPKTPSKVLLNWLDLFAIKDSYNIPGLNDKEINWNLRVSASNKNADSFERKYYEETIPSKRGISIPEVLSICLAAFNLDHKTQETCKLSDGLKKMAKIMEE